MKYVTTGIITLFLTLLTFTTANAQFSKEVIFLADQHEMSHEQYRFELQNYYNPWTIHKKIGQYGLLGSWGATAIGAIAMEDETLETTIIPIVGPFVTLTRISNDNNMEFQPGGRPLLIASGVTQGAFLVYMVVSWVGESSYDARHRSNFSLLPANDHAGTGLSVRYRF